jgi:hypothetical protein
MLVTHLFFHQKQVAEYLWLRTFQTILRGRYIPGCVGLNHSPENGMDRPKYAVTASSNVLLWFIKYVFCVGFFVVRVKVQYVIC